ncbi:hypothetical protein [Gracilibacillus lacisalsi]|uniref:hypothetical protein n=1 Tax=Gracilibacillus lacisalsi TaxID=393087 RepID=UPI00036F7D6A|nr:hypothetical protein [Gracilibacillus lacisalsi]
MFDKLKSYFLFVAGILIGIMIVSILRNGEVNWTLTGTTFALSVLLFISLLFISVGTKKIDTE